MCVPFCMAWRPHRARAPLHVGASTCRAASAFVGPKLGGHYAAQLYEKYRPLGAVVSRGAACPWAWRLALCLAFRVAFGFAGYCGSRFYLNQIQQPRKSIGRWLSRPEFSEYSNSTTVLRNDARCIPCDQGGTRTLPSTYE